ncbi:integrase [Streptomyces sp. NBC_01498]|uniref:integrase n=1 Tax=Streptomyces sp. NBC_01498 TaxID=2975870 RepID=UPI002E7BEC4D|nr:integrase [Streptomyces sp. NBC_01498]WTL24074.1 integrase [Streptomyces sp. NBC_01498]
MPWVEWRGNSCRVRWETGKLHPETGKKLFDSKSSTKWTETEAYDYGLDRESDVRNDRYISRRDGSVLMEDLCPAWLALQDLAYDSIRAYRTVITAQIIPYWGDRAVGDISVPEYDAWANQVRAKWSRNYAQSILMVFGLIMNYAVECEMRKSSPVIKRTRRGRFVKKARPRKRPLDMAVVHQLAMNAHTVWGFPGYVFFLTVPFTGLRRSEMFGLRREFASPTWPASDPRADPEETERYDDDMERYGQGEGLMPALRVEYQHKWMHGRPTLTAPKYESSRTLVLPPFLSRLHEQLLASHTSEWMFPAIGGGPLIRSNWSISYYGPITLGAEERVGKRARSKIPPVEAWRVRQPDGEWGPKRMHLLRHGHKEWLDEDEKHSRVAVEARMGHEVAGVEGLYGNVTPTMERRIMAALEERWAAFAAAQGPGWAPPAPIPLPVDQEDIAG